MPLFYPQVTHSVGGNTSGTMGAISSGTYLLAGGNNVTLSQDANTVTISAANQSVQTQMTGLTAGMSTLGNTFGTTGLVSNQLLIVPGGAALLSQSVDAGSATLTILALPAVVSNVGNTAGATGSWLGPAIIAGVNNITMSVGTVGNTVNGVNRTIAFLSVVGDAALSQWDPWQQQPVTNSTLGVSTLYIVPFDLQAQVSASRVNFFLSLTHTYSGAPNNSTGWLAAGYGIYTRMTGTGSDRMSLLTSYSLSYVSGSVSSSTRLSVTNYIGLSNATSHSTSQYGVNNASVSNYLASSIAGYRVLALPLNLTMNPGRYWMAFSVQHSNQGNSFALSHSVLQMAFSNNIAYRVLGAVSAASNASFYPATDGLGIYSAVTAAFPVSIPLTSDSIRGAPVMTVPYFNLSGIGTAAGLL